MTLDWVREKIGCLPKDSNIDRAWLSHLAIPSGLFSWTHPIETALGKPWDRYNVLLQYFPAGLVNMWAP
jgi:hypothetical protein